jgi:ribosomal protein L37AE/L43A
LVLLLGSTSTTGASDFTSTEYFCAECMTHTQHTVDGSVYTCTECGFSFDRDECKQSIPAIEVPTIYNCTTGPRKR